MKMTKEAQAVADAIEEVRFDWGDMEQSHPHTIAVAALRKVVEELKYIDDYGNAFVNADELEALANELEELK
jgi:pyruvate formate-lyase activating enzyme-like uncharacterized protein